MLLAGQVYATSLLPEREALEIPPDNPALSDRVRDKRPEPGVLVNATEWGGFWIGPDEAPEQPREPIRVKPAYLELDAIATRDAAAAPEEPQSWVEVAGSVVNVRSRPELSAPRVGRFERGKRLRVIERRGSWAHIEDPDTDTSGWMHGDYLAKAPGSAATS